MIPYKFNLAYWESSAVFQEHSNYVHYAASWILPQIRKKTPWVIYVAFGRVQFLAKIRQTLRSTFRTLFERSFHADHNGTIPSFISHSCIKIRCVLHLTVDTRPFQIRQIASPLSKQHGKLSCACAYILHALNLKLVHTCAMERTQWHNDNLQLAVG